MRAEVEAIHPSGSTAAKPEASPGTPPFRRGARMGLGWICERELREGLGGRPFGDGTPPPPPSADEAVPAEHTPLAA